MGIFVVNIMPKGVKMKTKIIVQPMEVKDGDAFENDVLDRQGFGEILSNLVSQSDDELVISLGGKWGEGKTTFVKMWQGLLTQRNIHNIYVNAYENDYSDDAFVAIVGEIIGYFKKNNIELDDFEPRAKKIMVELLGLGFNAGSNMILPGVITFGGIKKLKKIQSEVVNDVISKKLELYKKDVAIIQPFRDLLSKMPRRLGPNNDNPLVIIIDELDRCRPTYAIDFIEKVKHLFSVPNVIFVLVMNKEQLEESIKAVYGRYIDAHAYIQKFINIETSIIKRTGDHSHDNDIVKYNAILVNKYPHKEWGEEVSEYIEALAKHFNLSLRELEKVYANLAVFYVSHTGGVFGSFPLLFFLAVMKVKKPSEFNKLLHQDITYDVLIENIKLKEGFYMKKLKDVDMWIQLTFITDEQFRNLSVDDPIRRYNEMLPSGISRKKMMHYLAKRLSMFTLHFSL